MTAVEIAEAAEQARESATAAATAANVAAQALAPLVAAPHAPAVEQARQAALTAARESRTAQESAHRAAMLARRTPPAADQESELVSRWQVRRVFETTLGLPEDVTPVPPGTDPLTYALGMAGSDAEFMREDTGVNVTEALIEVDLEAAMLGTWEPRVVRLTWAWLDGSAQIDRYHVEPAPEPETGADQ